MLQKHRGPKNTVLVAVIPNPYVAVDWQSQSQQEKDQQ
jgi:hypothetical protein